MLVPVLAQGDPAAGRKKAELCISCHVASRTRPFLPVLDGQPRDYIVEQVYAFRSRQRTVEAMAQNAGNLKRVDIQDLADYFSARKPERSPMLRPDLAPAGMAKLRQLHCGTCHLPDYTGRGTAARLAGQNPSYTSWTLRDIVRGARRHPAEAAPELKSLTAGDIDLIAQAFGCM